MTSIADLLQQSSTSVWLFVPSAIMLGALHGLEPGHSKTMMAAFIIAIRGTVTQAVMLGLAATISHTAVVWLVAFAGLQLGSHWNAETTEPYFQVASAVIIIGIAAWMAWRTWRDHQRAARHDHDHHDHSAAQRIETRDGAMLLDVFEDGTPPRFRLRFERDGMTVPAPTNVTVTIETERADDRRQSFAMASRGTFLESVDVIPEPHEFVARVELVQDDRRDDYDVEFTEHGHAHVHPETAGLDVSAPGYQDAHELAHADDIRRRFANRQVTTAQIIVFGLTGGLIPCPAAVTILLICLQLKQFTLGMALVICFSIGLALTLVATGVIAALSVRHISRRWSGFGALAARAPYFSSAVIACVGLYVGYQGWTALI